MTSDGKRAQALAAVLAALAGYVDASGFAATGGFFVSFMSGNSTRMGVGLATGSETAFVAAELIGAFLFGVAVGALASSAAQSRRRPVVLALMALMLAAGSALSVAGATGAAVTLLAAAMGVENNVFERNGEVSLGVTYMTGSLVKLGQRIAAALMGTDGFGWFPYLVLWLSFVCDVAVGASAYPHFGLSGLWITAIVAAALAVVTWDAGSVGQQERAAL